MKIRFNLLPESQKKHLRTQKMLRTIMEQEIYVVIVLVVLILSLFAMYFLLKTEASIMKEVESEIMARSGYAEVLKMHEKFKDVHKTMNRVDKLNKEGVYWSRFFELLSAEVADAIVVQSVKVTGNHAVIGAVAQTREDVVKMKERFRETKVGEVACFENIVVPESNLAAPRDVAFVISFDVNVACLQ